MALVVAAAIAGCQPLPHPFADDRPPAALVAVPDNVNIFIGPLAGEPRATAAKLPAAIARSLLTHNIPASDMTASRASYRLDGRIQQHPDARGKSTVTMSWRLHDAKGNILREQSERLTAPTRNWAVGDDKQIAELAAATAGHLAALLTDETPKEAAGSGRTRLAVGRVAGAPGDGDTALAASLSAVLKHQDIELVDPATGRPDLAIAGEVKIDPPRDGKQHVKIVWHVAHAGGREIGQVAQENDVPRGRLDGPWGDVAYSVAMAAEGGIMQLVDSSVPSRRPEARAAAVAAPDPVRSGPANAPTGPPVAGNIAAPEVNLPPVSVAPAQAPRPAQDSPVLLPYRGVPIPH